ncbi:hypothetical protein ACJJTC_006082 [Scirpophaga incertulas]
MKIVRSVPATHEELRKFHSETYLDHITSIHEIDDEYIANSDDEAYGLGYDCPLVSNMFKLVTTIAGGSITAAKCLIYNIANVAINWCGGWHHAQRCNADGFCYVNDIVLAIETLRSKFRKVLYIDLDVHHGNGVQDAYNLSKSVFTLSFHKFEPGFYPGTGGIDDIGAVAGKGYSCNVPLHAWYSDESLEYVFEEVFMEVYANFLPEAIVVQCGADALACDPNGGAKLTPHSYSKCIKSILDKRKPTILLGGGGYKHTNAARLWATLTALTLGECLDENIPEHRHWEKYGPTYTLAVDTMLTKDNNKKEYLDECISIIKENLKKYVFLKPCTEPEPKKKKTEPLSATEQSCSTTVAVKTNENKIFKTLRGSSKTSAHNDEQHNTQKQNVLLTDVYDFID